MKKIKKLAFILSLLAVVSLVFAGCTPEPVTTTVTETKTQPAVTVTVTKTVQASTTSQSSSSSSVVTTTKTSSSSSTTSGGSVTTPTTTYPGLYGPYDKVGSVDVQLSSSDGKVIITKTSMSYNEGIHDVQGMYVQFKLKNNTAETVNFIVTANLYDNTGKMTAEGDILYRKSIGPNQELDFQIQTFVMKAWFWTLKIKTV